MKTKNQAFSATSSNAHIETAVREALPYPSSKVLLVFTYSPAMVGLLVGLYDLLRSYLLYADTASLKEVIIHLFLFMFMAELIYGLFALTAAIIINKCRWKKNAADICKAAIICAACAVLPTALIEHYLNLQPIFGLDFSFEMNTIAGVMGFILAVLALPSAHTLGSHELALQTTDQIAPSSHHTPDNNEPN